MKKILFSLIAVISIFICYTAKAECSAGSEPIQTSSLSEGKLLASNDSWKKFRENVAYCTDANTCAGYGTVWVNTDTYQVAFEDDKTSTKYDLTEYTGLDGYNMRFWRKSDSKYYYVSIYIPAAAFY